MEEKNEQEISLFQEWLTNKGWEFNESLESFVNKEKKEFKSNDELLEIYEAEKLAEDNSKKEEIEQKEKVQKAFNEFLSRTGWEIVDDKTAKNKKGDTRKILELVDDFKIDIQKSKEPKIETKKTVLISKSEIPDDIKRYEESEGKNKMLTHKYKGEVTRHDINPKQGLMTKRVKLYDKNDKLIEDFCFETSYDVK